MFTTSFIELTPEESISRAYDHFSGNSVLQSFSYDTRLTIFTAAIRTYCYDHDSIVTDKEIHQFLHNLWIHQDKHNNNDAA